MPPPSTKGIRRASGDHRSESICGGKTLQATYPWPLELGGVDVNPDGVSGCRCLYVSDSQVSFYVFGPTPRPPRAPSAVTPRRSASRGVTR